MFTFLCLPKKANSTQRHDCDIVVVCWSLSCGLMSHTRDHRPLAAPGAGNEIQSEQPEQPRPWLLHPEWPHVCYLPQATEALYPGHEIHREVQGARVTCSLAGPWLHPLPHPLPPSPCSGGWGQCHHSSGHPSWLPLGVQASVWDAWRPPGGRAGADG